MVWGPERLDKAAIAEEIVLPTQAVNFFQSIPHPLAIYCLLLGHMTYACSPRIVLLCLTINAPGGGVLCAQIDSAKETTTQRFLRICSWLTMVECGQTLLKEGNGRL